MDFSALLAIATAVTGLIWALAACKKRCLLKKGKFITTKESKWVEYARSFFPILLLVFILRSFVAEPFRIPSGSMKPTLLEGDFILVNKFIYGLRLPIWGYKLMDVKSVKRGDVLVFRFPKDPSVDFIKRVVGVPGDKISYQQKVLYVNGKALEQQFLGTVQDFNGRGFSQLKHYKEISDKVHAIYLRPNQGNDMEAITVPEDMYFVMGDNRDNSEDSRVWGFVPRHLILGKAFFIWLSVDMNAKDIRWQRIGKSIE